MTKKNKLSAKRYMNGELLFMKHIDGGLTIASLVLWSTENGMISKSGNSPTDMGIWKAMWRWASTHKNEAWEIVHKNSDIDYHKWHVIMVKKRIPAAWQHSKKRLYERFLKDYGWLDAEQS